MRVPITEDDDGRRLESVAKARLGVPRSLLMKLLRTGGIRLNGKKAKADARVAIGDVVEVADGVAREGAAKGGGPGKGEGRPAPPVAPRPPADFAARVVFEDADVLVFDKPPGMVAHVGSGHEGGLVDLLHAHLGTAPDAAFRPALVNRLDRDTSGLVVLAKSGLALRGLNATIRAGGLEKGYLALVRGVPEPPQGEVRAALRKDAGPGGRERMEVVPDGAPGALAAVTGYRLVERLDAGSAGPAAIVDLEPRTGRTHQLRAHLAHLGHPIACDARYGDPDFDRALEAACGARRLFLHAARLRFPHPRSGAVLALEAPLARDLAAALGRLGWQPSEDPSKKTPPASS